jgi:hypothetical protein
MGAAQFHNVSEEPDVEKAFIAKRDQMAWEYGHGGYAEGKWHFFGWASS